MLNQRNCKRLRNSGLMFLIKSANAHALREAGRLIYNADHRVKTDMRIRMQLKTHEYRQNLHKRPGEVISNGEVGRRFDAYLGRLSCFLEAEERTDDEQLRLGHLLKVLTHLRPGLVQCYDREGFPRTNNEMERMLRAIKMQYRRIS